MYYIDNRLMVVQSQLLSWVPWVLARIQSFLAVTLAYKQL